MLDRIDDGEVVDEVRTGEAAEHAVKPEFRAMGQSLTVSLQRPETHK
jgi:hypothetical protein